MKKLTVIILLCLLAAILCSCAFVTFHPFEEGEEALEATRAEYLAAITALSDANYYGDDEKLAFEIALQDAVNELNECGTLKALETAYNKHASRIQAIPTLLPNVIATLLAKLQALVDLADYRAEEQATIRLLQSEYEAMLEKAVTVSEAEDCFRNYQADVSDLKTDAVYYAEEVAAMKEAYTVGIEEGELFVLYRAHEQATLKSLISTFKVGLRPLTRKEEIEAHYSLIRSQIDAIPTHQELYEKEKATVVQEMATLLTDHGVSEETAEELIQRMEKLTYHEEVRAFAASYLIKNVALSLKELRELWQTRLENSINTPLYRENQLELAEKTVKDALAKIKRADTAEEIDGLTDAALAALDAIPTNDEAWRAEDEAFLQLLKDRYGDNHLALPESLTEASDLYELAAIIDFYAFYQTDYKSFLRDTFRVKLCYDRKNPQWEINEVYWYAELLRSAVGITGYYEADGESLVITLVPYALATESNLKDEITVDRYDSLLKLPNSEKYQARDEDFNGFAYLSYPKTVSGIWSTQQLWYALEHEYLPVPIEDSPAQRALEKAESILREIIYEGMSDEEKVYAIFSWFGQYVTYDNDYVDYLNPDDRDHYPDELAATLNAFHIEGALFENLAVCCSFAKTYLLFLRMEGIEAYRITLHAYTENAIGNPSRNGYGSHAILAIRGSDGKFYYSDAEESYNTSTNYPFLVKYHQLLTPPQLHWPYDDGYTRLFPELEMGEGLSPLVLNALTYGGESIVVREKSQLNAILSAFKAEKGSGIQISFFVEEGLSFSVTESLSRFDMTYAVFTFGGVSEYMIYK